MAFFAVARVFYNNVSVAVSSNEGEIWPVRKFIFDLAKLKEPPPTR